MSIEELEAKYEGKGYGDFKKDLVEVTVEALAPIKERYEQIRHSEELIEILKDGAAKADAIAKKTMARVKENFGLGLGR
jgi:tryptophanyl-tRNA synthetase